MNARGGLTALGLCLGLVTCAAATAHAQNLGTFRWQTEPYCNVISLTVLQQGSVYQLVGTENLCGSGTALVTGTAVLTASGVQLAFTVAAPGGRPTFITATVSPGTLSGRWNDGEGNEGPFTFSPVTVGGAPRPLPASRVLSAAVNSSGVLLAGVGVVSVSRSGFIYQVNFNREVANCAVGVSVVQTEPNTFNIAFASANVVASSPQAVRVKGFGNGGTSTLVPFTLTVACP